MRCILNYLKNPFKNYLYAFSLLFSLYLISFISVVIIAKYVGGGFIHYNTDDIIQYYPFMAGFIEKLKNGQFSIYDTSFFVGASSFSSSYYIPIDIFTGLTFLLSYLIQPEIAYAYINLFKPLLGGIILFYILKRQGFKPITCFFTSFIFSFGGLYATNTVFPVYLSILFYLPLGVLVVDIFRENKYKFYLIVLYTILIILYDFYIAYMLLAFIMIYMLMCGYINDDYSLLGKKSFIINKKFYLDIGLALSLILLGLFISCFIFLPNFYYITDHTFRNYYDEVLFHYNKRHYFIFYSTFFLTSNPIRILIYSSDYIRNHASMFMTIFGFIFLIQLFFLNGKKYNRLKLFVLVFNFLITIPAISMMMTGTNQGYIRWFFIVYFINLYAASFAMEKLDFNLSATNKTKIIASLVLISSIIFIFYTYFISPSYKLYNGSDYYYPIIIIFFVTIFLYTLSLINKKFNKIALLTLLGEIVASITIVFTNAGNDTSYYLHSRDLLDYTYNNLMNNTSFEENGAYRIAMSSAETDYMTNSSFIYNRLNSANFFHSFYDSEFNTHIRYYLKEYEGSWSKREQILYQTPFNYTYGVKYHIVPKNVELPLNFKLAYTDNNFNYYEIENMKPFIIYDEFIQNVSSLSIYKMAYVNTLYGSFADNLDEIMFNNFITKHNLKQRELEDIKDIYTKSDSVNLYGKLVNIDGLTYNVLDVRRYSYILENKDMIVVNITNQGMRDKGFRNAYILDTLGNKHYMYYGQIKYDASYTPKEIYLPAKDTPYSAAYCAINIDELEALYLNEQNQYQNEFFSINDSTMHIEVEMNPSQFGRILKTNFTYSEEWVPNNSNYQTVNILGGYLGIIIPPNTSKVNVDLNFIPQKLDLGLTISSFSFSGFIILTCAIFVTKRQDYTNVYM